MKKKCNDYDPVSVNDTEILTPLKKSSLKCNGLVSGLLAVAAVCLALAILVYIVASFNLTITMSSGDDAAQLSAVPAGKKSRSEIERETDLNELAKHTRAVFMEMDVDGDNRLNLQEFVYFLSVTGSMSDIFELFSNDIADSFSVKDLANVLEFVCTDKETGSTESCEVHLDAPTCQSFDSWRKCLEYIALGIVTQITGDENAGHVTRGQYTEYAAKKAFDRIAGDNEFIEFNEFKTYQQEFLMPYAESYVESHPITDYVEREIGFKAINKPLISTQSDVSKYKEAILTKKQRKAKRRLETMEECCERYDCDSWDAYMCSVYAGVCAGACIVSCVSDACVGCTCLMGLGFGWCNEAYNCINTCGCEMAEDSDGNDAYMDCGSCDTDFMR